MIWVDPGR